MRKTIVILLTAAIKQRRTLLPLQEVTFIISKG